MDELVEEAGLPHARLADHGDHLPMPPARPLERPPELLQLGVPPHEPREPARRRAFEPCSHGARTRDFINLDRLAQPLDPRARLKLEWSLKSCTRRGVTLLTAR